MLKSKICKFFLGGGLKFGENLRRRTALKSFDYFDTFYVDRGFRKVLIDLAVDAYGRVFIDGYASPVLVVDLDFDSVAVFIDELVVLRAKLGDDLALKYDASVIR